MISESMRRVLYCLRPHGPQGQASYPPRWNASNQRHGKHARPAAEWFRQCVDNWLDGDPMSCKLEPNIGVLAEVQWRNGREIVYANLQAVIVQGGDLEDLYLDQDDEVFVHYLRLDFDLQNTGLLFREPQPHIHVYPKGEPRLAMSGSGNIVVAFLEFLYRNYRYREWEAWVSDVWKKRASDATTDENPLPRIIKAFDANKADYLYQNERHVGRLKNYLRQEADAAYPGRVPEKWLRLFDYSV